MPTPVTTNQEMPFTPGEVQKVSQTVDPDQVFQKTTEPSPPPANTDSRVESPDKEVTKVTDKKDDVKFDDFLDQLNKPAERKEGVKPDTSHEATQPDKKKEIQPADTQQQKPTETPPEHPDLARRDYTGLPDDIVPLFKKMGREAFDTLKPIYLERQQQLEKIKALEAQAKDERLKLKIPDSWHEHEDAYTLSPEYRNMQFRHNQASAIYRHWMTQLEKVRAGKDWEGLAWDEKASRVIITDPEGGGPQAEAWIISQLTAAQNQSMQLQDKVESIKQGFKQTYTGAVGEVQEAINEYFKEFQDEKHPMRQVITNVLNKIPPVFRGHPLAQLAANTAAQNVQLRLMLDEMVKKNGTQQAIKEDKRKAGPNMGDIGGVTAGSAAAPKVEWDDFQRLRSGVSVDS